MECPDESKVQTVMCGAAICFRARAEAWEVLLIRRGTPPRRGEWSIPGGRMEPGEEPEACALRELEEETGVSATMIGHVETVEAVFDGVAYRLHDFAVAWRSGEPVAADDADEAQFFRMEEIAGLHMWAKTEAIIRDAHRLLKLTRGEAGRSG